MTKTVLLGLLAETPIHVGIGQAAEALDLPVAREHTTRFPHIPGSGVKGAFRVWAEEKPALKPEIKTLFGAASGDDTGNDAGAGTVLFGEARLALLPMRCTTDSFKLATCPLIINRLLRDMDRAGMPQTQVIPSVLNETYLGQAAAGAPLGLEEREFTQAGTIDAGISKLLKALMGDGVPADFDSKLVILSDGDFKWFAEFGLPVAMRNALDENKIVKPGALWAEETLAPDTVMWMVLSERSAGATAQLTGAINNKTYVQMGGNETIGQGWFSVRPVVAEER